MSGTSEHEQRLTRLEMQTGNFGDMFRQLQQTQAEISESLKTLVRLEVEHAATRQGLDRAFTTIDQQREEIAELKRQVPPLVEMRGWVIRGMLMVCGVAGMSLLLLVIKT